MATTAKRKPPTTTEKGLGWRHRQAVDALKRRHQDGSPCDWDGRPMYLDRTRNWDYNPEATYPTSGELQGDHRDMPRAKALALGLPIPPPDRLLHAECNRQRGDGRNDHLAWSNSGKPPLMEPLLPAITDGETYVMAWPWRT